MKPWRQKPFWAKSRWAVAVCAVLAVVMVRPDLDEDSGTHERHGVLLWFIRLRKWQERLNAGALAQEGDRQLVL